MDQSDEAARRAKEEEERELVSGLLGAIYASKSLSVTADKIEELATTAGIKPADDEDANKDLAKSELEAMDRAAEIPSLDKAAKALTGVTLLLTGLFTGIGFSTGDFAQMIRDHFSLGLAFLICAGFALLSGTFAVAINAYRSKKNLRGEQAAVYLGIGAAVAALVLASIGISKGASATLPAISASFDTTSNGNPELSVSASSTDMPRSEYLIVTVWGKHGSSPWVPLGHAVTGPTSDGNDSASIPVNNITDYTNFVVEATLSTKDHGANGQPGIPCPTLTSCLSLTGSNVSPATPVPSGTP